MNYYYSEATLNGTGAAI